MIVRPAMAEDAEAMTTVLNEIIALGGTTAHDQAKTAAAVRNDHVSGPHVLTSVVAGQSGQLVGWQSVELWQGDGHIGTFVIPGLQANGIGGAMFGRTCEALRGRGVRRIFASIRADNVPGLAYYARMGFVDYAHDPGFALKDGRVVGRVDRRFDLV